MRCKTSSKCRGGFGVLFGFTEWLGVTVVAALFADGSGLFGAVLCPTCLLPSEGDCVAGLVITAAPESGTAAVSSETLLDTAGSVALVFELVSGGEEFEQPSADTNRTNANNVSDLGQTE